MGFMEKWYGKITGNSIDSVNLRELQEEQMRLKNQLAILNKEMTKFEKQKKDLFKQGVGADLFQKKMKIMEIKQLEMQVKLKFKNFNVMSKQFMFISNFVVLKQFEKQLKASPIWAKLKNIEPALFERMLINTDLNGKSFEGVLDNLNGVFELSTSDAALDQSVDESEKQMLDAWSAVETGSINVDDASKIVSTENQMESKDTDKEGS
jgi:hypothetical protein